MISVNEISVMGEHSHEDHAWWRVAVRIGGKNSDLVYLVK